MADISVGSVSVAIVPSAVNFAERLRESILPEADIVGGEAGDRIRTQIDERLKDIKIGVDANTLKARADLDAIGRKADEVGAKKEKIDVTVNNASGIRSWITSLVAGAVAIAPAFVVAGAGVLAFGALAAPSIRGVTKYLHDLSIGAKATATQWQSLTQAQKIAATQALALKSNFSNLSKSIQPEALSVFDAVLNEIDQVLPEITPVAKAAGVALTSMVNGVGTAFTDSDAQKFFQFLTQNIGPDSAQITQTLIALIHAFFSLTEALHPVSLVLLQIVTQFARFLSFLSDTSPVITGVIVLAIALYKPLKVIEALNLAKAFTWIPSAVTGLKDFTIATEGATLAEKAQLAGEVALDAISPWVWAGLAVAGFVALIAITRQHTTAIQDEITAMGQQDKATGFNLAGFNKYATQLGAVSLRYRDMISQGKIFNSDTPVTGQVLAHLTYFAGQYTDAQKKAIQEGQDLNSNLDILQKKYGLSRIQAEQLATQVGGKGVAGAFVKGGDAAHQVQLKIAAFETETHSVITPAEKFKNDLDAIANAALGAAGQIKGLTDAYNNMISPNVTAEGAVVNLKNDLISMNTTLKKSHDRIGDATQAQRDSFGTFKTYIDQINTTEQSTLNATGAQRKHDLQVLDNSIPELQHLADHDKNLRGEIEKLIQTIQHIPAHETTDINVLGSGRFNVTQGPGGTRVGTGHNVQPRAMGGLIAAGTPGVDDQLILAQKGELVVPTYMVEAGEVDHLRGQLPGFDSGGVVGHYSGAVPGLGPFTTRELSATTKTIEQAVADAAAKVIRQRQRSGNLPGGDLSAHGGSAAANQQIARRLLPLFGFGPDQVTPLIALWNQESGWNQFADNASSGAYGIPQSLPASKMASAGPDYLTNPVTHERWGLGYIRDRYGNPAGAWAHEVANNWYDDGGMVPPGASIMLNGTGRPGRVLTNDQWDMVASAARGGDGGVQYHAHFDGFTTEMVQTQVQTAFRAMDMKAAVRQRIGRRR